MKILNKKIIEECKKAKTLREQAFLTTYDKAQEIRKEQQKIYDKYIFLKNLEKAIGEVK